MKILLSALLIISLFIILAILKIYCPFIFIVIIAFLAIVIVALLLMLITFMEDDT